MWDLVEEGYNAPTNVDGIEVSRKSMNVEQKNCTKCTIRQGPLC